jgi:hypothetical protein
MVVVIEHKQTIENGKRKDHITFYPEKNRTVFNEYCFYGKTSVEEFTDEEAAVGAILEGMDRSEMFNPESFKLFAEDRFIRAYNAAGEAE